LIPTALVLAGSRGGEDPVAIYAGVSDKALINLGGTTMLARVLQALRDAGVQWLAVSASNSAVIEEAERHSGQGIAAAAGPSASVGIALRELGAPLLVTTGDHALLRAEWVTDFVARVPADADVAVLLARREAIEVAAPGSQRTYLRFADGHWSGCNLFYLATPRAEAVIRLWQAVEQDRKRPWRIVRRLGPMLLLRYLVGRLSLAEAIAHLGRRAGVVAAVVECPDGLAAVDVDKPSDLDFVRARLDQQRTADRA
jgi:GTP:adenosylcobinamide-phosphate guanylyltransferase